MYVYYKHAHRLKATACSAFGSNNSENAWLNCTSCERFVSAQGLTHACRTIDRQWRCSRLYTPFPWLGTRDQLRGRLIAFLSSTDPYHDTSKTSSGRQRLSTGVCSGSSPSVEAA
ncbi:TPA: hypothetical protein ACH3X2_002089 [Trebouxia sp. C0005]